MLIKEYEVCDRKHLLAYEQLWISKLSTIEQNNTLLIKKLTNKIWYEANKDKIKNYREDNKERLNEYSKIYRSANKDKIKEQAKDYYYSHKEQKKQYRAAHKERLNEKASKWYEKNKDKIREQQKNYYESNKERKKQKYVCECGSEIRRSDKSRHERSVKHQAFYAA